jgi:hypothetical protein
MTQDVNARSRPAQPLVRLLVATFALLATTPAAAQTLYRCGNTYQDRPCSGADAGRVVGRGDPRADGNPRTALHTDCAQRGEAALRIMWLRQAGARQDQVRGLSDRNAPAPEAELIAQVYQLRGTPPEVRAAVEQQCATDLERATRDPAFAAAMAERVEQAERAALSPPLSSPSAAPSAAVGSLQRPPAPTADTSAREARCDDLRRQREALARLARDGGSISQMEALNRQRRALDEEQRASGC